MKYSLAVLLTALCTPAMAHTINFTMTDQRVQGQADYMTGYGFGSNSGEVSDTQWVGNTSMLAGDIDIRNFPEGNIFNGATFSTYNETADTIKPNRIIIYLYQSNGVLVDTIDSDDENWQVRTMQHTDGGWYHQLITDGYTSDIAIDGSTVNSGYSTVEIHFDD